MIEYFFYFVAVDPRLIFSFFYRMDKDGTLDISFDEWRDYLLFHPSANLHDIILYWRHATVSAQLIISLGTCAGNEFIRRQL